MHSRLLLNVFMFLLLISLGSFAFFYKDDTQAPVRLTSLVVDDISTIVIERTKGDIQLEKKQAIWYMRSPYKIPAHDFRIQHLLKLTQLESLQTYSADAIDLSAFSLDKPRARIRFNHTLIEFGRSNPITQQRYIKSGNLVMLIHDDTYSLLRSQVSSFVDLKLLPENSAIQAIKLPNQYLQKQGNNWILKPEENVSADDKQNFIQQWKLASAFAVHNYLKRKQLGHVEIVLSNTTINFEISDTDPWLILARPELGIEYHFDVSMVKSLLSLKPRHLDDE